MKIVYDVVEKDIADLYASGDYNPDVVDLLQGSMMNANDCVLDQDIDHLRCVTTTSEWPGVSIVHCLRCFYVFREKASPGRLNCSEGVHFIEINRP
jgi:hypothetical protein